jgi:uncharacterized membrane protein
VSNPRNEVLQYVDQGRLQPAATREAMQRTGALPDGAAWHRFLDRLLLWLGTVMLGASLIFFLAYNWQALGRFAKFGLAEAAIVAALVVTWRVGLERPTGKAALLAASIFAGALFALVGQIYQTGADTFELFATWALAIVPWALVGGFAPLWLLWLAIVDTAIVLYFLIFPGFFGLFFTTEHQMWILAGVNTLALVLLEWRRAAGTPWLSQRWSMQVVATSSAGIITALAVMAIMDLRWRPVSVFALLAWLAWMATAWFVYRRRVRDVFILALGALSLIVVTATFLGKHMIGREAASFFLVSMAVIGLTGAAGWWLRQVAKEEA